jgi:5-methylcytosine-specific restriction endonuclease McrA
VVDLDDAIRDHVIPLAEGGADVYVNTQLLCPACDRLKTHADSARGAARARR